MRNNANDARRERVSKLKRQVVSDMSPSVPRMRKKRKFDALYEMEAQTWDAEQAETKASADEQISSSQARAAPVSRATHEQAEHETAHKS